MGCNWIARPPEYQKKKTPGRNAGGGGVALQGGAIVSPARDVRCNQGRR